MRHAALRALVSACATVFLLALDENAAAQVHFSGEASVNFLAGEDGISPRVVNEGRPTFGWRGDFFADAIVSENVSFLSNIRIFQNEDPTFDFLAIRVVDVTPLHLNFQLGKFDVPFGNLGERRFPSRNPLYSLPLMYEYPTNLQTTWESAAAYTMTRGEGAGLRILDFGIYDIGVMVYGSVGIVGYAIALTNGTVSAPSVRSLNTNRDFGKLGRMTLTPMTGLTIGASYQQGTYLSQASAEALPQYKDHAYIQQSVEADFEFSTGHISVCGQGLYGMWDGLIGQDPPVKCKAKAWYGEVKYTVIPRLFVAARVNQLLFDDIDVDEQLYPWDYNVFESEAGVGYALERNVIMKAVFRMTKTDAESDPRDNLFILQTVVRF